MKQFRIDEFNGYVINMRKQVFKVKSDGSTRPLSLRGDGRYVLRDISNNEQYRTPDSLYWSTMEAVRHSIPSIRDVGYPFSKYMIDRDFNVYSKKSGMLTSNFNTVSLMMDDGSNAVHINRIFLYAWTINTLYSPYEIKNLNVIMSQRMMDRLDNPGSYRFDIGVKDMRLIDSDTPMTLLENYIGYASMKYGNGFIVVNLSERMAVDVKEGEYNSIFSRRNQFNTKTRGRHFLLPVNTTSFGSTLMYVPETALEMSGYEIGQNIIKNKPDNLLTVTTTI